MSKNVRLYRFYNLDKEKRGEPFAECDHHIEAFKRGRKPAAPQLILEKIADEALWSCNKCDHEEAERTERLRNFKDSRTQKDPVWNVVVRNREKSGIGVSVQSDAWSYREDLSDIDQVTYEIIAKTRPVREA
jgi:hypothetical protein